MRYEEPLYRPPCEAQSLIIQATIGCPHNRCDFCSMYKEKKFRIRPVEEILTDIRLAKTYYGEVQSVFLADGNTIAMKTDQLVDIISFIGEMFPRVERISCYGSAKFIKVKSAADLARLREAGLSAVYLGLESGDDEILAEMHKGATADEMVAGARKLKAAGIVVSAYVLLGLGGQGRWQRHARETARVLNAMDPSYIRPRTLSLMGDSPLQARAAAGEFVECTPTEIIQETRELVAGLEVTNAQFASDHVSNYLPIFGTLPDDKEHLLKQIDFVLDRALTKMTRPRTLLHL